MLHLWLSRWKSRSGWPVSAAQSEVGVELGRSTHSRDVTGHVPRRAFRNPFVWSLGIGFAAIALGFWGYRALPGASVSVSDAAFRTLQLFAVDAAMGESLPWQLNLARFLAPFALGFATVAAVLAVAGTHVRDRMRLIGRRDHVVLVGLGGNGRDFAEQLLGDGRAVVVVEAAEHAPVSLRVPRVPVVLGDPRRASILRRARVHRARHVVVATNSDTLSLDVARAVREMVDPRGRRLSVHVAVEDAWLATELGRMYAGETDTGVRIEVFNPSDRAALALARQLESLSSSRGGALALHDCGPLISRALVHSARRALCDSLTLEVTSGSDRVMAELREMVAAAPWLSSSLSVVGPSGVNGSALLHVIGDRAAEESAIGRALTIARESTGPVLLVVEEVDAAAALSAIDPPRSLVVFQSARAVFTPSALDHSMLEVMARARHEDYLAHEVDRPGGESENPSMVTWEELPEALKESNRDFARSLADFVRQLNGYLMPLSGAPVPLEDLLSTQDLERLAVLEHDRWVDSRIRAGWTLGEGPKDVARMTHPLLIPWEELDEKERQKDRDAVSSVPQLLARVGYEIRFD